MLPDSRSSNHRLLPTHVVSMHLMVLGASRPSGLSSLQSRPLRLNAPDGAGCFPMESHWNSISLGEGVSMHLMVLGASRLAAAGFAALHFASLNAPDGAGCFPTCDFGWSNNLYLCVSMHLMVLGASRPRPACPG